MALQQRTRRILLGALAAWLVLSILGVVFRDALASFVAARVLAQRGFECAKVSVHVPLRLPPSPIALEPTRCGVTAGPLQSIDFQAPLHIRLAKLKPGLITIASLAIDMRPRAHRDVDENVLGALAKLGGFTEPALELMFDTAELSRQKSPPILADHATVTRGGAPVAEFHDLRVTSTAKGMVITSPEIHAAQAAVAGPGELRMTASSNAATVNVKFLGALKVKIDLQDIGATKPKAAISIGDAKVSPQPDETRGG